MIVTHEVAQRAPTPPPRDVYSVVNSQLAAFRAADFPRAYRNASSVVQQKFSLPQFENMIRRNYSEMTQRQRVEFGFVRVEKGTAFVQVFFFAGDGSARAFLYSLVAEDQNWKIEGVERILIPRSRPAGLHA